MKALPAAKKVTVCAWHLLRSLAFGGSFAVGTGACAAGAAGAPGTPAVPPLQVIMAEPTSATFAPASPASAAPVRFRPPPFTVLRSREGIAFVDLDLDGGARHAPAPQNVQLLDERGVRVARLVEVRKECASVCGEDGVKQCHVVGEYRHAGPQLGHYPVAFDGAARVVPRPIDRTPMPRDAQLAHLGRVFAAPVQEPVEAEELPFWSRPAGSDDWAEHTVVRVDPGRTGRGYLYVKPTGRRFAACSLAVHGALTEFVCPKWRTVYLGNRLLGGIDNYPPLGSPILYAAEIDGTPAHFLIVEWNSVMHVRVVFRRRGVWHDDGVEDDRTVC